MTITSNDLVAAPGYAATVRYYRWMGLEPPSPDGARLSLADEFAEVDNELRRLKVRRDELRQAIIDRGQLEIVGTGWTVVLEERTSRRLDPRALVRRFSKEAVDECRTARTTTYLRTERL